MTRAKFFFFALVLTAVSGLAVSSLSAGDQETHVKKPQTVCPVMGGEINKDVYVDYQGQRVYFCCPGCKPRFEADPESYMLKFQAEGILLASVQTSCPVSGMDINKAIYSDYKGRRVYFCSAEHKTQFDRDPEECLKNWKEAKAHSNEPSQGCPCGCAK